MNQRYQSDAVVIEKGDAHTFKEDPELVYQHSTVPGSRLPHVWLTKDRANYSSLDLVGHGSFTLLTGIGGEGWVSAATAIAAQRGLPLKAVVIGPGHEYEDPFGDWSRASEIEDDGAILVRPDHVVAWRSKSRTSNSEATLKAALDRILAVGR
jgi:2,4-dichlorophenol 6-monooxygenase